MFLNDPTLYGATLNKDYGVTAPYFPQVANQTFQPWMTPWFQNQYLPHQFMQTPYLQNQSMQAPYLQNQFLTQRQFPFHNRQLPFQGQLPFQAQTFTPPVYPWADPYLKYGYANPMVGYTGAPILW